MAKLRNVQFYRNEGNLTSYLTHSDAMSAAQTTFGQQLANMQDGEMLLYRYTITGDDTVHTITGVVRKNGSANYVEILANADMLFSGNAADVTYVNSTSGLMATNVQDAIDEVEGRVDTLEQGVQSLNAVMGVIVDSTELTKDGNGKVTIDTDDDHAYDGSNNPLATVETVTSAVSALNTVIGNEFTALNGTAGIASASNGVVTLKAGVIQTDGKIANSSDADITLKKVATTAESEDVFKTTDSTAAYNTTAGEISQSWVTVVNNNALADGNTVDTDLNKLDTKIAGLADEFIAKEQVTAAAFNSVKNSVGLENDFSLSLSGDTTNIIKNDTNVKAALLDLANAIGSGSSDVKGVEVDGSSVVNTTTGIAGIFTDANSPYNASSNKIATVGTVTNAINALDVPTDKGAASISGSTITINAVQQEDGLVKDGGSTTINLDGSYNETNNKIATQDTVKNAVVSLNSTAGIASVDNQGVVTIRTTVNEVSGLIQDGGQTITLAKVAYNGVAGLVAIQDPHDKFTATDVEEALYELKTDIANVVGGMRYNGGISDTTAPVNSSTGDIRPGDIYLASGDFTIGTHSVEAGDMIVYKGTKSSSTVTLTDSNCNVIEKETDTMVTSEVTLTDNYLVFGDNNKQVSINSTVGGEVWQVTATELKGAMDAANDALQSISHGTDGTYVTTNIGTKTNNDQSVAVSLTYGVLNSTLGVTTEGVLNTDSVDEIKAYIDAQAASSGATVSEGDAIDVTETTDSQTGVKNYEIDVKVSANAVQGTSTTRSTAANLLIINADNELAVSDTWDCGTY